MASSVVIDWVWRLLLPALLAVGMATAAIAQASEDEQVDFSRNELYRIFVFEKGLVPVGRRPKKKFIFPGDADDGKVYGIDVSHHKGVIDWARVAAAGAKFSYTKATQGRSFVDKRLADNMTGARSNGIPTGAYHFLSSNYDIEEQVQNFIRTYDKVRRADDLPPVLDLEWDLDFRTKTDRWAAKSARQIVAMSLYWLAQIESKYGVKPIIYTNKYWWEARLGAEGRRLARYRIWMSRYGRFNDAAPPMPTGLDWALWQFTEHGQIPGIRDRVDVNFIAPDFPLLAGQGTGSKPAVKLPPEGKVAGGAGQAGAGGQQAAGADDPETRRVAAKLRQRIGELVTGNARLCSLLKANGGTCTTLLAPGGSEEDSGNDGTRPPPVAPESLVTVLKEISTKLDKLERLRRERDARQADGTAPEAGTPKPESQPRQQPRRTRTRRRYPLIY